MWILVCCVFLYTIGKIGQLTQAFLCAQPLCLTALIGPASDGRCFYIYYVLHFKQQPVNSSFKYIYNCCTLVIRNAWSLRTIHSYTYLVMKYACTTGYFTLESDSLLHKKTCQFNRLTIQKILSFLHSISHNRSYHIRCHTCLYY